MPDDTPTQDELSAEVEDVLGRVDPVPPELIATLQANFVRRTLEAELAALLVDPASAPEHDDRLLVRGDEATGASFLTFESPALTLEVEVVADGRRRRILGQVVPPQRATIEVGGPGGTLLTETDQLGRFVITGVEPGPVLLRCRRGDEGAMVVETDWFVA